MLSAVVFFFSFFPLFVFLILYEMIRFTNLNRLVRLELISNDLVD